MGIRSSRCQRPSILKSPARSCNRTDDVARAIQFDEEGITRVVKNIAELAGHLPEAVQKCLTYFPSVDRTVTDLDLDIGVTGFSIPEGDALLATVAPEESGDMEDGGGEAGRSCISVSTDRV